MNKKEELLLKDSSIPIWNVEVKESVVKKVHFTDFGIDSTNYIFDREEANAR